MTHLWGWWPSFGPAGVAGVYSCTANDGAPDSDPALINMTGVSCFATALPHGGAHEPGDSVPLSGDGFDPDSPVGVWLTSDPVFLGSVLAAGDGTVSTAADLPLGTELGAHALWLIGNDEFGASRALKVAIDVDVDPSVPGSYRIA